VRVDRFPRSQAATALELNAAFVKAELGSLPEAKVRIFGYEWELLEERGYLAGRTLQGWYEYFLATNDLSNLERLLGFYVPPAGQVEERKAFTIAPGQPTNIEVVTDPRLIAFVSSDPAKLLSLTPREFEVFTAELLEKLGYSGVSIGKGSKDGGVDVTAHIRHALGVERVIVQCKRQSHEHKVGEPVVKQLITDTEIHNAARGLIVTTSYLTRGPFYWWRRRGTASSLWISTI
jgi:HJR/Mrr/RecB family endonuclease